MQKFCGVSKMKTINWFRSKGYEASISADGEYLGLMIDNLKISYDIVCRAVYVKRDNVDIFGTYSAYKGMSPWEFVEKIDKGEWL